MNRTVKLLLISLLLFAVIAVSFTYFSIEKAKSEVMIATTEAPTEKQTEASAEAPTEAPVVKAEHGIDLYGTYDTNDLIVNEMTEMHSGVEITYPKIEGLKDKAIEDKINADLYGSMMELISGYDKINYASFYVRASFANVMSVSFHVGSDDAYEQRYLNYELLSGERIALEDLFKMDADILGIVRSAFYNASAAERWFEWEGELVSPDENRVYKLVKSYMEDGDKVFSFTPSGVHFYIDQYVATAKMLDFSEDIVIYSKYLTEESIYENDELGYDNIFTCAECGYETFETIDYGYAEDNLWYDVTVWPSYMPEMDAERTEMINIIKEQKYQEIYEFIEEYKEKARSNPDRFYIILAKPSDYVISKSEYMDGVWDYTYSDAIEISSNIQVFEMPMELYESRYRDAIIDTYRYEYFAMRGGAYLDTENLENGVKFTQINDTGLYNYRTGEELDDFSDIFKENYDYMSFIRQETFAILINRGYTAAEAEEFFDSADIRLNGGNVEVQIEALDFPYSLSVSQFDISQLKIFGQEG